MFRLCTLGRVDLRDAEGREVGEVLGQPKRLALLAWLAITASDALQRRDLLLPLFWPELPEERARNALRQAIHQLRRALGGEAVRSLGAEMIGVNASDLWCDVPAFETALSRGALEEAVALYRGDLLPGFAVAGAAEFEHWLEERRRALRLRAVRAAWALAHRHERGRRIAAAVDHARHAVSLAPDDEAGVRQLLALLARAGEDAAAVDAYTEFAHRLQRDGMAPSPETTALVEAMRARPRDGTGAANGPEPPATRGRARVTIAPFANLTGEPAWDFVGRLASEAIAQGVIESRAADVVMLDRNDAAAKDATERAILVSGSYSLRDDAWMFLARIGEAGGRTHDAIGDVRAPRERPWEAADELRRRVSGTLAGRLDPRFASWANVMAQAPHTDAHRELAVGADLHLRGDFRAAIPHLLRAGATREQFTLPILWAVQASCNLGEWEQAESILTELTARSREGRLSAFEQLACEYFMACLDGQHALALRIARRGAELVPDSEVLSYLGREALFCNQPRAAAEALERLDAGRGWIPSWTPHWRRLTEAYHMLGEHDRELDAAGRGRDHHPEALSALLLEARAYAALGDRPALERLLDDACAHPPDQFVNAGEVMLDVAAELRTHGNAADALSLAVRAIAWHEEHSRNAGTGRAYLALARAQYEAGRWRDAGHVAARLAGEMPDDIDVLGLRGAVAARLGEVAEAERVVGELRAKTGRFRFGRQYYWSARILAVLARTEPAITALRGAFARGHCHGIEHHTDMDLALLAEAPAFREMMRPKG